MNNNINKSKIINFLKNKQFKNNKSTKEENLFIKKLNYIQKEKNFKFYHKNNFKNILNSLNQNNSYKITTKNFNIFKTNKNQNLLIQSYNNCYKNEKNNFKEIKNNISYYNSFKNQIKYNSLKFPFESEKNKISYKFKFKQSNIKKSLSLSTLPFITMTQIYNKKNCNLKIKKIKISKNKTPRFDNSFISNILNY